MATKKRLVLEEVVESTVDDTVAPGNATVVIEVPIPLEDVQLQAGLFRDRKPGRYILQYNQGYSILPISVYWTGTEVVA
jgi:hypothetical protein